MLVVALGFVAALVIAWAYELTPEGIKRESEVERDRSVTHHTAKKLNVITLVAIIILIAFLAVDRFVLNKQAGQAKPTAAAVTEPAQRTQETSEERVEPDIPGKSIAVLPLANRSVNEEDAFFAEGIHDEILTRLARIGSLKVISRTSVMGYTNTTKKMAEIGLELGVATLLEGGVQRAGNRVRINVQLIEAATDRHLWAEVYDRELTTDNLFDIQSEITRSISDALQAVLTGEEQLALDDKPTDNVEAYAYYLRAKALAGGSGRSEQEIRDSIGIYQSALELDPGFAAAWAGLATDWTELHWQTAGVSGERDRAEAALAKARELAPESAETLIAEGYLHYWGYLEYQQALDAFNAALARKPGSTLALRGTAYVLRRMGRLDESIATFRRAIDLDPNDPGMPADLGYTMLHRGRIGESEVLFRRAVAQAPDNHWNRWAFMSWFLTVGDLDGAREILGPVDNRMSADYVLFSLANLVRMQGDQGAWDSVFEVIDRTEIGSAWDPLIKITRGMALFQEGRLDEYRDTMEALEPRLFEDAEKSPDPDVSLSGLVMLYGMLGDREKLEQAIRRFETELKPDALRIVEDTSRPYAWAMIGDKDKALDYAEQLVEEFGIWEFHYFVLDPIFDGLRGEPRYKELALRYDRWLETVK